MADRWRTGGMTLETHGGVHYLGRLNERDWIAPRPRQHHDVIVGAAVPGIRAPDVEAVALVLRMERAW